MRYRRTGFLMALLAVVTATIAAFAASAAAASFNLGKTFASMAVDDSLQRMFVSLPASDTVDEFNFSGQHVATLSDLYGAAGMTINGNYLYVVESNTGQIVQIDLASSTASRKTIVSGLDDPGWLVMTGSRLWTTEDPSGQWGSVVSVNPSTGATSTLAGSYYDPDLAVSPGDPSTLFIAEDGLSPGAIYRLDVAASPPKQVAANGATDQSSIEGLAVSADGKRVIPAAGSPYLFEELSATTLQADGYRYPAYPYPDAVAVSASGLLAGGLEESSPDPDILVYPLGTPATTFTANTDSSVVPHGLALSADGSRLFAVTTNPAGTALILHTYDLPASS